MAEMRPCGKLGWAYCDGNCSACRTAVTTAATTTVKMSYHPMSNADRIRAMSDEELARWIWAVQTGIYHGDIGTTDEWLSWLQSPAEGGGGDAN